MKKDKNIITTLRDWLYDSGNETETVSGDPEDPTRDFQEGSAPADCYLIITHPVSFTDAQKLSEYVRRGKAVIIVADRMQSTDKQRLLDFLSGVALAKEEPSPGSIRTFSSVLLET